MTFSALEILGYFASVVVAVSLMMKSIIRLRWYNLVGAVAFPGSADVPGRRADRPFTRGERAPLGNRAVPDPRLAGGPGRDQAAG